MATHVPCPKCKEYTLHRSRSRSRLETIFKKILPARIYRCHHCQWRGWISNNKLQGKNSYLMGFLFYVGVIILALVVASGLWSLIN